MKTGRPQTQIIKAFTVAFGVALPLALGELAPGQANRTVDHQRMVQSGIQFLQSRQQADGSFSGELGAGVTALVGTALLQNGVSAADPVAARCLQFVESLVQPDGGIYRPGSLYRNYETCLAVMCLSQANASGQYDQVLADADRFLKSIQWGSGIESSDPAYGGAGYGKHKRPDLSNTSFLIDALRQLGNPADNEAIQQALVFVSRCQNLPSPHNQTEFADKVQDGGFYYTAAAGGTSQAGETANGGLRSYASMTYAGLKSMIYAGVQPDDRRVQAALSWISRHYDLTSNPGMGNAGLYYYYHTFAKALAVAEVTTFVDQDGQSHDWRDDLNAELARRQQPNGAWINENDRWMESNPDLVTAYALLALSYTRPDTP